MCVCVCVRVCVCVFYVRVKSLGMCKVRSKISGYLSIYIFSLSSCFKFFVPRETFHEAQRTYTEGKKEPHFVYIFFR